MHVLHVRTDHGDEYINFFFEATRWQGEPRIMEPHKCDALGWFEVGQLPAETLAHHIHIMNMIDQKSMFSEFGWQK